jgi:uncharacterized protein YciI
MPYFSYLIKPYREDFVGSATDEEAAIVGKHFEYLQSLLEQKVLVMAGRTDMGEFGIGIFECESIEKMREISANDPAVKNGVFIAEVYPFHIALWRDIK